MALNQKGIAVFRCDFSGSEESEEALSTTKFTLNVSDLLCEADWLKNNYEAPK